MTMTDIKYVLTSEITRAYNMNVRTYGVICIVNGKEYIRVSDITPDRKRIKDFVRLCNELNLSPDHLHDAVYNLMARLY